MSEEHCPRCDSDRITISYARKAVMWSCKRCYWSWGDVQGYHREAADIRAEERAKPQPFRGEGPPMLLLGVNPWWFR